MRVKVIKTDESVIFDHKIYGFEEEFELPDAIGKSLIERGVVVDVSTPFQENKGDDENEVKEGVDINEMSYPELKSYASKLGLSSNGKKDELITRINEYFEQLEEADTDNEGEDENDPDAQGDDTDNEGEDESPNTSMPE